jgi:hypothetical protein
VVELVDTYASGAYAARREGSSPFLGTNVIDNETISDRKILLVGCRRAVSG